MDQRVLGRLAAELAPLAALGTPEAAAQISLRIREEARRQHLAPWTLTRMVGGEWVRTGTIKPGGAMTQGFQ